MKFNCWKSKISPERGGVDLVNTEKEASEEVGKRKSEEITSDYSCSLASFPRAKLQECLQDYSAFYFGVVLIFRNRSEIN